MLDFTDYIFLAILPLLLTASAFFSGCETALFGLSGHQRYQLTRPGGIVGRSVTALLHDPRVLLVTLMLGNMTVNVLYFVISSAVLFDLGEGDAIAPVLIVLVSLLPLLMIILFGEMLPKLVASNFRLTWVRMSAVPLLTLHSAARPLAVVLSRFVIEPLGRLFAPRRPAAAAVTGDELSALLDLSQRRGVIGTDEQRLLRDVLGLSQLKVSDVMVPRVDMVTIDIHSPPHKLRELIDAQDLTKIIATEGDIDHVAGVIYARQFLLAARLEPNLSLPRLVKGVRFVPELQRLDDLLEDFRRSGTNLAVAVDEYGGTAGLITLKDVVEQVVGDLDMDEHPGEGHGTPAEDLGDGRWRVSGRLSVHDWSQAFGGETIPPRISTVGGLVTALLGRFPAVGDSVRIANIELTVQSVERSAVTGVILRLLEPTGGAKGGDA